ncbi:MAG: hypothetical protein E7668_02995 [Ruminococcaceae bacterium]|nr:hypothetical protein [Oscillospiraceae bacterium]
MKHVYCHKQTAWLLLILLLCLSMLLTSCFRIQKKSGTESDTKPVAEAEEEEEYLPDDHSSAGTGTKLTETQKPVETDADGNRIFQTVAGKTPMQMYTATQEQLLAMKEYEIEAVTNLKMSMAGITMDMKISQTIRNDGENAYHKAVVDGDPTESWYIDGLFYQRYYDDADVEQKIMQSGWTLDSFLNFNHVTVGVDDFGSYPQNIIFENDYFTWDGSHYVIEYSVPKEQAVKFLASFGLDTLGTVNEATMNFTLQFNVMGRLQNAILAMTATLETENGTMELTASGKEKYLGIGTTVNEVTPPADAHMYIDYGGK